MPQFLGDRGVECHEPDAAARADNFPHSVPDSRLLRARDQGRSKTQSYFAAFHDRRGLPSTGSGSNGQVWHVKLLGRIGCDAQILFGVLLLSTTD